MNENSKGRGGGGGGGIVELRIVERNSVGLNSQNTTI